jgi:hypothetical protein
LLFVATASNGHYMTHLVKAINLASWTMSFLLDTLRFSKNRALFSTLCAPVGFCFGELNVQFYAGAGLHSSVSQDCGVRVVAAHWTNFAERATVCKSEMN